jgi:predicted RNA-binding protein YlqC (UPF0109 family)
MEDFCYSLRLLYDVSDILFSGILLWVSALVLADDSGKAIGRRGRNVVSQVLTPRRWPGQCKLCNDILYLNFPFVGEGGRVVKALRLGLCWTVVGNLASSNLVLLTFID